LADYLGLLALKPSGYNEAMSIVSQPVVSESMAMVLPALISSPSSIKGPAPKRWTREEYYRLAEQGWFQNQRVELIDGEIYLLSPQSPQHFSSIERVRKLLEKVFGEAYWIRSQGPLLHGDYSEPEPDIAVVRGSIDDHDAQHPRDSVLVVEVSKSSLRYDKQEKQFLYASMKIADYWILDLDNRQLIIYRDPKPSPDSPLGFAFSTMQVLGEEAAASPLELPGIKLAVSSMLPSVK
jgi:Uma2 family endonuclease